MRSIVRLLLTFSAAIASWAACPAGVNPAQIITANTWAFQLVAGDAGTIGSAAVGTFAPLPNGILKVVITYSNVGVVTRRQEATARYILYPDCTGGEFLFYVNGLGFQTEFVFVNNFTQIYMVTDYMNPRIPSTSVLTGIARPTTPGCPPGLGDTLDILKGTTWSFRTFGAYYDNGPGASSVGMFTPFNVAGQGRLVGTETITYGGNGPVVRGAQLSGRYLIYPDCSGGEIMLMNRGNPVPSLQMEFVFAGPNFREMYMLNDSDSNNSRSVVAGIAKVY